MDEVRNEFGDVEVWGHGDIGRERGGEGGERFVALAERLECCCLVGEGDAMDGIFERWVSQIYLVFKSVGQRIPSQPLLRQRQPPSCSVTIISVYRTTSSFCASSRQS